MELAAVLSVPLSGSIAFAANGRTLVAHTDNAGHFLVHLVPGVYRVTGRSPKFQSGSISCAGGTIHVYAHKTNSVSVDCEGY